MKKSTRNRETCIFRFKNICTLFILFSLSGCQNNPGEECLQSFAATLKDPNSGKVIDFTDSTLTYTATNSYGARIQGKAICYKTHNGKWERAHSQELIKILQLSTEKMVFMNECRKKGNPASECFGGSAALERAYKMNYLGSDQATEDVKQEAAEELGFD